MTPPKNPATPGSGRPGETRNIAILAHVDAGKTTVSERLLYFSDTIPGMGEVDEGLATMDYLEEEKKRGITIEAGIASYSWKGTRVTFVDTPGHVDFGVEVDFALRAVEGVVLVLSGISGIESQSLEAWEKIKANRNRTLIFINKLDLPASDYRRVMEQIQVMFAVKPVALTLPVYAKGADGGGGAKPHAMDGVIDVLNQLALYRSVDNPRKLIKGEVPSHLAQDYAGARKDLLDVASRYNDEVLAAYLKGEEPANEAILAGLREAMAGGHVPVFMGSALRNVGIRQLMNGINLLLPPPLVPASAAPTGTDIPGVAGPLGFVIKIRHYQDIGKIFLAKVMDPAALERLEATRLFRVFAESLVEIRDRAEVSAGDIVAIQSPRHYSMGQYLSAEGAGAAPGAVLKQYRPLLQSRIELVRAEDHAFVDRVLKQVAETEPSIAIAPDPGTGGWLISTVGELQLDVFCKRLKKDHKCDIKVGAPSVRYLERLKSPQRGLANTASGMGGEVSLLLDILPRPDEEGNTVTYAGNLLAGHKEVVESTFDLFCSQGLWGLGAIAGLECRVVSLQGSPQLPLPLLSKCFADCLKLGLFNAHFEVFEPIMKLEIITPDEFCGQVLADLAARGGIVRKLDSDGYNSIILLEIPLANTFGYTTLLRSLSKGLGVYVLTYEKHGVRRQN